MQYKRRNDRALRERGITIRKTIDTLIATRCIESAYALLYSDRDFDPFVTHLGLSSAMGGAGPRWEMVEKSGEMLLRPPLFFHGRRILDVAPEYLNRLRPWRALRMLNQQVRTALAPI